MEIKRFHAYKLSQYQKRQNSDLRLAHQAGNKRTNIEFWFLFSSTLKSKCFLSEMFSHYWLSILLNFFKRSYIARGGFFWPDWLLSNFWAKMPIFDTQLVYHSVSLTNDITKTVKKNSVGKLYVPYMYVYVSKVTKVKTNTLRLTLGRKENETHVLVCYLAWCQAQVGRCRDSKVCVYLLTSRLEWKDAENERVAHVKSVKMVTGMSS